MPLSVSSYEKQCEKHTFAGPGKKELHTFNRLDQISSHDLQSLGNVLRVRVLMFCLDVSIRDRREQVFTHTRMYKPQ